MSYLKSIINTKNIINNSFENFIFLYDKTALKWFWYFLVDPRGLEPETKGFNTQLELIAYA